ncbi:tuberoinfundibular peptide of 39 residues [Heteronotia binoei]|uniref:tuberoinfundibular peptide of 39 residues n=1 Tax=Heteronotia binoei TaxID=13085 RepID=UPI00292CD99E|nr:tuberoinfundibular peptide of 39 residues [Heteronotia binoei]
MPLQEVAEGGHGLWLPENLTVPSPAGSGVMEPKIRSGRGLWLISFFLSSCVLFSSGALLPKLHNSGRLLWKHDVSQNPSTESGVNLKAPLVPWGSRIPSITLRDWSLKWTSSDVTAPQHEEKDDKGQNRKSRPWDPVRQEDAPSERLKMALLPRSWMQGWGGKRSLVVADDAAFREKSKMLTAMERQKWLNSYIQKFLVVNSE